MADPFTAEEAREAATAFEAGMLLSDEYEDRIAATLRAYADSLERVGGVEEMAREVERLREWVHDLQAGMYINCVYCGHRYGPDDEVPATMADALKEHVEQCPDHPMSELKRRLTAAQQAVVGRAVSDEAVERALQAVRSAGPRVEFVEDRPAVMRSAILAALEGPTSGGEG